jgi:hypothetical protein
MDGNNECSPDLFDLLEELVHLAAVNIDADVVAACIVFIV